MITEGKSLYLNIYLHNLLTEIPRKNKREAKFNTNVLLVRLFGILKTSTAFM